MKILAVMAALCSFAAAVALHNVGQGRAPGPVPLSGAAPRLVLDGGSTGRIVAVQFVDGRLATLSSSGEVRLRDPATGQLVQALDLYGQQSFFGYFPSPDRLLMGRLDSPSAGARFEIWDTRNRVLLNTLPAMESYPIVHFSQAGVRRVMIESGSQLFTVNTDTGTLSAAVRLSPPMNVDAFTALPSGQQVVAAGSFRAGISAGGISLFDTRTGRRVRSLELPPASMEIAALGVSPDGNLIAGAGQGGQGFLAVEWDVRTGRIHRTLNLKKYVEVKGVQFLSSGSTIAVTSHIFTDADRGRLTLWQPESGALREVTLRTRAIETLSASPDGLLVGSGGDDGTVDLCSGVSGAFLSHLPGNDLRTTASAFSPDGRWFGITTTGGSLHLWDAADGKRTHTFSADRRSLSGVFFSPDGRRVWAGAGPGFTPGPSPELIPCAVLSWSTSATDPPRSFPAEDDPDSEGGYGLLDPGPDYLWSVSYSPQQHWLVGARYEEPLNWWNTTTGRTIHNSLTTRRSASAAAISPDGSQIVTGDWEPRETGPGSVKAWDSRTLQPQWQTADHLRDVWALAYSPDGKVLAAAGDFTGWGPGLVLLLDPTTGRTLHSLAGQAARVVDAAFSPDGALVAAVDVEGQVRLWEASTGRPAASFQVVPGGPHRVRFSPAGRLLAVTGGASVTFWDIPDDRLFLTLTLLPGASPSIGPAQARTPAAMVGSPATTTAPPDAHSLDDWIAWTPEGFFDGSPGIERSILWQTGNQILPSPTLSARRRQPGILAQVLRQQ